jgi:hypothetical protein
LRQQSETPAGCNFFREIGCSALGAQESLILFARFSQRAARRCFDLPLKLVPTVRPRNLSEEFSENETFDSQRELSDDLEVVFQRSRRQRIYEERGGLPRMGRSAQYNGYLHRDYYCIHDYRQSPWGTMLREGEYREPFTKAAKDFRRRFRVPADIFHKMVEMCDAKNVFECAARDAAARIGVPIEMKLLACLRVLGRGAVFDDIEELSGMSKSTAHRSFKAFIRNFSHHFYAEYVYAPEGEALQQVMDVYSRLGFDGAIGSTDCVHVKMDQCPGDLYWRCKGKEGYPTLVYSVVVDHAHRIMHSTASF